MSARIWKFPFEISGRLVIPMPKGAQILHVEPQDNTPTIWALVDTEAPLVDRTFFVFGTGHQILDPETLQHLTTFLCPPFVWHMFEAGGIEKLQAAVLEHDRKWRGESNTKSTGRV